MDFESLPGSQIYLTRQLELRWFHHWEVAVDEVAKLSPSSAASKNDHDAMMTRDHDHDVNQPTNNGNASNGSLKGRLVRKQRHTMPFLQRNIATNTGYAASRSLHIIKRHRANVRGRPNKELMIAIQNGKYNPSLSFAASLKMKKKKKKVIGVGWKKRQAAAEEADDATTAPNNKRARSDGTNKNKKPAAVKKDAQQSAPQQQKPRAQKQHTSSSSSTDSFPSFAIYSQTSSIRTKLLDALPKEFHGDETFILDKLREQWLLASRESKRLNGTASEGSDYGKNSSGDGTSGNEEDESASLPPVNESTTATKRTNAQLNDEEQQVEVVDPSLPLTVSSNTNNRSVIPPLDMAMSSLQKYDGTKQHYKQNQSLPPAYFHYVFMQPNNVLGTHVEEVDGRVCPLCNNLFDGKTNEGLLRHLGNCHGTLMESPASNNDATVTDVDGIKPCEDGAYFEAALGEEGQLHIVVRGVPFSPDTNHDKDFVFVQPRLLCKSSNKVNKQQQQQSSNNIPYLQRQNHKTATLDPITRNKKLLTLQSNDAPASAISAYLPTDAIPLRQYFHADTNLPMSNDSWDRDDSCNNVDETWRSKMSSELLEDIEDVTPKEKMFMKLWNGYIKCNHVLADRDMSFKCRDFVRVHCKELVRGELRLNLLLHLFNLWDNGVISEDRILVCMEVFDEYRMM